MMYRSEAKNDDGFYARVVAASNCDGTRIDTLELRYPRFIHAEFMTHRMFSRNASSSRAIPAKRMIEQVTNDPAMPIHYGQNQPGMQAGEELPEPLKQLVQMNWRVQARNSAEVVDALSGAGLHKQVANRLLEPFQFIKVIVTATEWENFFNLRLHPDAQPEIQELARLMRNAMDQTDVTWTEYDEWHMPYVTNDDGDMDPLDRLKCSVARCARVSYMTHDNGEPDRAKDLSLHDMLLEAGHMSPFEHQATPMGINIGTVKFDPGVTHMDRTGAMWSGNFKNWRQYRQMLGELHDPEN